MSSVEDLGSLYTLHDAEEAACQRAQELIKHGGPIGRLIGRLQHWVYAGELSRINDEIEIAELYQGLDRQSPA